MRKLIVLSFITLDGVMQAPGGPEEDPTGGFKHGGWVAGYFDDFLGNVMDRQMNKPFALLLGRRTYEIFAAHWPYVKTDGDPIAAGINNAKKYVASKTLINLDWSNSELIKGDVAIEVGKLKEQEGPEIQVHGSGGLIQTLLKHDLVDELRLKIFPITLGRGKRLFAEGTIPAGFKLLESENSPNGVIVASYARAGEVKTGSFALSIPTEAELARRKRLAEDSKASNKAQIMEVVDNWVKAVRAKDVNGVMSNYAPDILLFDLAPPLSYRGADAYRKNWEEWFASWQGLIGYEIRDLSITVGDDVAFSHSLNRITGTRTNAEKTDVWVRATACFRKIDDKWLIAHEHVSVPFYMDGSDKAALDLNP